MSNKPFPSTVRPAEPDPGAERSDSGEQEQLVEGRRRRALPGAPEARSSDHGLARGRDPGVHRSAVLARLTLEVAATAAPFLPPQELPINCQLRVTRT